MSDHKRDTLLWDGLAGLHALSYNDTARSLTDPRLRRYDEVQQTQQRTASAGLGGMPVPSTNGKGPECQSTALRGRHGQGELNSHSRHSKLVPPGVITMRIVILFVMLLVSDGDLPFLNVPGNHVSMLANIPPETKPLEGALGAADQLLVNGDCSIQPLETHGRA